MNWFEIDNKNPKRAFIIIFITVIAICIIISLVFLLNLKRFFLNTSILDILAVTLGALALPLGAISLAVSIIIASRQDIQILKLKTISEQTSDTVTKLTTISKDTGDTVKKLTTESAIQDRLKEFFNNHDADDLIKKYKCIYPVYYNTTTTTNPLPQVSQADFYVFHVLGSHMDEAKLEILGVQNDQDIEDKEFLKENAIFICTKNPCLTKFYEIKDIKEEKDLNEAKDWLKDTLKLPCWFVNDHRGIPDNKRNIKILVYTEPNECGHLELLLESPANEIYITAQSCGSNIQNPFREIIQRDYAIFARLSKSEFNSQHIIIAGIHQHGTWIVGELLNRLLYGEKLDYYSTFLDNNDFICIITGEFSQNRLKVKGDSIQIYNRYIWIKEGDRWTRKYTEKTNIE